MSTHSTSAATSWLVVLSEANAIEWVVANQRMVFRPHVDVSCVKSSDRFVLYVTRGAFQDPARDQSRVFCTGVFLTGPVRAPVEVGDVTFAAACALRLDVIVPARLGARFKPLVPKLKSVDNKANWAIYVRRTLIQLCDDDYDLVASHVAAASQLWTAEGARQPRPKSRIEFT